MMVACVIAIPPANLVMDYAGSQWLSRRYGDQMLKRTSDNVLNGGQIIVDYLIREKVPYAFGLCGHGNIGFIDALYERSGDIKTNSVHHEAVAGFRADVYYRVSRQPIATFTS